MNIKTLSSILVNEKDGFYRVPAEFDENFKLIPEPEGQLNLVFFDHDRMRSYLQTYGYEPEYEPMTLEEYPAVEMPYDIRITSE